MPNRMRLDKFLAQAGAGTRSRVKEYIRKGNVTVNGQTAKNPALSVDASADNICLLGKPLCFQQYHYYMLNKPAGVVTATRDGRERTVMDLLREADGRGLFPVGRLDKDTVGLLLITDDGELSHRLISPKKHVEKTYYAECGGVFTEETQTRLEQGVDIGDDKPTLPAKVTLMEQSESAYALELTITEGRYHQIKRMIHAVGGEVAYLKRTAFGGLALDASLAEGEWRALSAEEVERLRN